jgi:membrane protein YqaA with SNARE-associated domain
MTHAIIHTLRAPSRWMRSLYDWTVRWARTRKAPYALFTVAFIESSFFPIPPDAMLIPMVVADRARWFRNALLCSAGSVLGAMLGYLIGWGLYETVGKPIVDFYGLHHQMEVVGERYQQNAFLAIVTAAFTPIPFKVFTIAAGLFHVSLPVLLIASAIGRSARFFIVAGLLRLYGQRIADSLERNFNFFSILFMILLIGGFVVVRYIF